MCKAILIPSYRTIAPRYAILAQEKDSRYAYFMQG